MRDEGDVNLSLTGAEALVLFDWLARSEGDTPAPFLDQAEQRVLRDMGARLESVLVAPLAADYGAQLAAARATVRDAGADSDVEFRCNA